LSLKIEVSLKEIYKVLCKKCKAEVKKLVSRRVSEKLAEKVLEE